MTRPSRTMIGSRLITNAQSGHHEDRRDLEDLRPDLVQNVDDIHGGILPVPLPLGARRGLPRLVVAPRPGCQPGRSSSGSPWRSAGSPTATPAGRAARGFPTDGDDSLRASSRPSSQAEPAVRAPRSRAPWLRSRSSVTTSSPAVPSAPSTSRTSSIDREDDRVGRARAAVAHGQPGRDPLVTQATFGRTVEDELDRGRRRDRPAEPADQRAAGGAAPADDVAIAWSRFEPSTRSRRVAASGSRSRLGSGLFVGIGAIVRGAGRTATIGRGPPPARRSRWRRVPRRRPRPGRRRGPCRSRGPWRRRRLRDQQLDALPDRLPDPPRGDGRAGLARDGRVVRPGDGARTCASTTPASGACWSSAGAGSSASCATSATTWSRRAPPRRG